MFLGCRYPTTTFHGVAEKELEYVTSGYTMDEGDYTPTPGFTPADMPMDGDRYVMSPDAARLLKGKPDAGKPDSNSSGNRPGNSSPPPSSGPPSPR